MILQYLDTELVMGKSMYYEEANDIISKFDLKQTLLQKGITTEHLAYLRGNKPKDLDDYYEYYDYISQNDKNNTLVETKKIIGINRADECASYFDNAIGKNVSNLNIFRMATAIEHISNDTLNRLYDWYENLVEPVQLIYFMDDDVYQVGSDGNHRSLYAIIIDAPLIKANVKCYKCNKEKQKTFLYFKKVCSDYMVTGVSTGDYYTSVTKGCNITEVTFLYNKNEYVVMGYKSPEKDGSYCWEQISVLKDQLGKDFNYLKRNWLITFLEKHSIANNIFLKYFCKDPKQAMRLRQHIYQRKNLTKKNKGSYPNG